MRKRAKGLPRGEVDPRNQLNELNNTEWMIYSKSVWTPPDWEPVASQIHTVASEFHDWLRVVHGQENLNELLGQLLPSIMISKPAPRDELKVLHPATFPEEDVEKLIRFFTKRGEWVLDPFVGSGSACIAAIKCGRHSVGIELIEHWAEIARRRVNEYLHGLQLNLFETAHGEIPRAQIIHADAREALDSSSDESFDFILTSPPYWNILHKDTDHKVKAERLTKGLPTRYSDEEKDLGNLPTYDIFLTEVAGVFAKMYRVLKAKRYLCVIVSDFRHRNKFYAYHSDLAKEIQNRGFSLEGITILAQDSKNLYPYGIPYAFVSNIHHQYVLVFRKNSG